MSTKKVLDYSTPNMNKSTIIENDFQQFLFFHKDWFIEMSAKFDSELEMVPKYLIILAKCAQNYTFFLQVLKFWLKEKIE